jgi:hypothetical protein
MSAEEIVLASPNPNKGGRPSNKEKPLGRASNTMVARKLGNVAPEAMDLIIEAMRNTEEPMERRTKNAQWIVTTMMNSLKEVDRQTLQQYTIERLKKENGKELPEVQDDDEDSGNAVFSLSIVK